MKLVQQTENTSDFDVILTGEDSPAFRVLLPEHIRGKGIEHTGGVHVIPGSWHYVDAGVSGRFTLGDVVEIGVDIETDTTEIQVELSVLNTGPDDLEDVWVEVCAGMNHLPGNPGWSNSRFLPSAPLDRSVQGRYWFESVAPHRLCAFTDDGGWIGMHPCPDAPDAGSVPLYSFTSSETPCARACAVQSPDGAAYFFEVWNTPCCYCTPCPGNACMHMVPFVSELLVPGSSTSICGIIGVHDGDRDSLMAKIDRFVAGA